MGSEVPDRTDPARSAPLISRPFRHLHRKNRRQQGCAELFDYLQRYAMSFPRGLDLVLVGNPIIAIPSHHRIHHLGYLSDEDKFDALAAADLLIMPSISGKLCRWSRSKPGRWGDQCWPTAGATCSRDSASEQRRALLRELRGVHRDACIRLNRTARFTHASEGMAASIFRATTRGR